MTTEKKKTDVNVGDSLDSHYCFLIMSATLH